MTEIKDEVRGYIVENIALGDATARLSDEDSLIDLDMIDSTGVIELVTFIHERFGIAMADEDITPDNLDSVAKIAAYICKHKPALAESG